MVRDPPKQPLRLAILAARASHFQRAHCHTHSHVKHKPGSLTSRSPVVTQSSPTSSGQEACDFFGAKVTLALTFPGHCTQTTRGQDKRCFTGHSKHGFIREGPKAIT